MSKKKVITQSLFVIGALAIGLFYLFDDPSSEAETSSSPLYHTTATYNGEEFPYRTIMKTTDDRTFSVGTYMDTYRGYNDNLYVAWGNDVHYTYHDPECVGEQCWKIWAKLNMNSTYGVEAANIAVGNTPLVCFFLKNNDTVRHQCVQYTESDKYAISSTLADFKVSGVSFTQSPGLPSAASSVTNPAKFYVAAPNKVSGGSRVYVSECTLTTTTNLVLNDSCSNVSSAEVLNQNHPDPAIVVVPTETDEAHFTFFRKDDRTISYYRSSYRSSDKGIHYPSHVTPLTTIDGATNYKTSVRPTAYYHDGYVYLAWKRSNSTDVVIARIAAEDLLNEHTEGKGKWVYNDFKNPTDTRIAFTHHGPSFFEYENGLYLLWSSANDNNNLAYYKIQPDTFSRPVTVDYKGYLGHARADEDTIPDAFVTPDNQLYVLWAHGGQVAYSRWPKYDENQEGYTWEGHTQTYGTVLKDTQGTVVTSEYGVETMFVPNVKPDNIPMLCLFTRQRMTYERQFVYRCSTGISFIDSLPGPTLFHPYLTIKDTYSLISTTQSSIDKSKFFAVYSYLASGTQRDSIHQLKCSAITQHTLEGACSGGSPGIIGDGLDPSIIAIADEAKKEHLFAFYRGPSDYKIYYRTDQNTKVIPMKNHLNETRETDKRPASYVFNGEAYVVWKNKNNYGIRLAKTSVENLLSEGMAENKWEYCQLKNDHAHEDNPQFIADTKGTPNLFEYNNRLYILYVYTDEGSDKPDEDKKVSFFRIDDIDVGGTNHDHVRCDDFEENYKRPVKL